MLASTPDLLRLLAVPLFAWAAWRDIETRRLPNVLWYPPLALGVALLAWELWARLPLATFMDRLFLIQVALSLGFVIPLALAFWWMGAFGGADAKAFVTIAVLFPTYPAFVASGVTLPLVETTLGVFSMTILTNTVLLAVLFPFVLAVRNFAAGERTLAAFLAHPVPVPALSTVHGKLFETPDGFTRRGLDVDALRMYLRWRGTTLAAIRADPDTHRDPASIDETFDPGDGRVAGPDVAGTESVGRDSESVAADVHSQTDEGMTEIDDPWGAERFLDSIEGSAYGTTPDTLRDGLELVATRDRLWVSPGLPFIVPLLFGLLVALTYGDLLFGILIGLGLV